MSFSFIATEQEHVEKWAGIMYAVLVTFHFELPDQPSKRVVEAHQKLLDRMPLVRSSISLRNRTEYAFLLAFQNRRDIDAYLESPEFCLFRSSPGCYDVFVKVLDFLEASGDPVFSADRHASDAVALEQSHSVMPV